VLRTSGFGDDVMSAHDGDEQATRKMAYAQSHSPDGRTDCSVTFVKTPDNTVRHPGCSVAHYRLDQS